MMPETASLYAALRRSAADALAHSTEPDPTPEFHVSIGWFPNYDALFRGVGFEQSDVLELAKTAIRSGRVVLAARGGASKTVTGRRLARALLERGAVPVVVDLKQWRAQNYDDWKGLESSSDRIDYILARFAPAGFGTLSLNALSPDVERVLFVDGLNEVLSRTAQEIITAFEEYVRYAIRTGIIVADRLVRRDFVDPKRWRFATVLPLSVDEVRRQLHAMGKEELYAHGDRGSKGLLAIPYFLNAALHSGDSATTSAQYFERHSGLDGTNALDKAAKAAYDAYKNGLADIRVCGVCR